MKNFKKELMAAKVLSKETVLEMAEAILNGKNLSDQAVFEVTVLNGTVYDKDKRPDPTEDELWDLWISLDFSLDDEFDRVAKELVRKSKFRKTRKNSIRDKARHGWNNGSRRSGQGHYEKWLLPERQEQEERRDRQSQIMDMNLVDDYRQVAWDRVSILLNEEKSNLVEALSIVKMNKDLETTLGAVNRLEGNCQEWWNTTMTKKIYGILDEFPLCEGEKKELVNRASRSFLDYLSKRIKDTRKEVIRKKIVEDIYLAQQYNVKVDDLF